MELVQKLTWLLTCSIFIFLGTGCKEEVTLEEKEGWYDSQADSSLVEDPSLFDLADVDGAKVLRANTDGVDIHSHYLNSTLSAPACEYSGSFYLGDDTGGLGVTFASSYPDADAYYRFKAYAGTNLRVDSHPKQTKPSPTGTVKSDVLFSAGQWYQFRVRWQDVGSQTEIFAKAWPEGSGEPDLWQIEAIDADASRYTNCRIGVWAAHANGQSYWNNLQLKEVGISAVPSITSEPAISVDEGEVYEYQIQATPDASYTYSATSSSDNVTLDANGLLTWQHEPELVAPLTGPNSNCDANVDGTGQFDPVEKWHWDQGQVRITPMVGQLSDDNDDGVINTLDTPDIVFTAHEGNDRASARMVVLNGDSGTELNSFHVPGEVFHSYAHLALGDIDNDGVVEIITTTANRKIVAYEHTGGAPKWSHDLPSELGIRTTPALYDLDGDGSVEILMGKYVFGADGQLIWTGGGDSVGAIGTLSGDHHDTDLHGRNEDFTSFAMEFVESSPGLEVVVGNQVYSASGTPIWTAQEIGDGASAMGDVDGDGDPELVIVSNKSRLFGVVDHTGERLWQREISTDDDLAGPPTLSDINGDGMLEIGFVTKEKYYAYSHTGDKIWDAEINDDSSGITGSTVFDFEGDGKADIVYFDEDYLRVFDEHGVVKFQIDNNSGTWIEYPVIADIDNDGHADIVIPSSDSSTKQGNENTTRGVRAFKDRYNTWPATRPIWNQHAYHIDNINDDGTVPANPAASYQTHNTFRLSSFEYGGGQTRVDFTLSRLRLVQSGSSYDLLVNVINRTDVAATSLNISFYHGDPIYEELIGSIFLPAIGASETQTLRLENVDTSSWDRHIHARIEYNGRIPECLTTNNEIIGAYFDVIVSGSGGNALQEFIVTVDNSNLAPRLPEHDPFTVEADNEFTFVVNATDPDVGDQLRYSLLNKPSDSMRIDPNTGAIHWVTASSDIGSYTFRVRVEDSEGLSDETDYSLDVIANQGEPPVITSAPLRTAYQQIPYEYQVAVIDEAVESLVFTAPVKPSGMNISPSGLVTWTPSELQSGPYDVTVKVTDQTGQSDEQLYSINVEIPRSAYTINFISVPAESASVGAGYEYQAIATTNSDTDITYSLAVGPVDMEIDPASGLITWVSTSEDVGLNPVTVKAIDGLGNVAEQLFAVRVENLLAGPKIVSTPITSVYENKVYEYLIDVEPNASDYQFSLLSSASNASIDQYGRIRWTPDPALAGSLTGENTYCSVAPESASLFEPVLKWHWNGGQVRNTPLVAQLSDDNNDGKIDDKDIPDVVFIAYNGVEFSKGWLVALDGATGEALESFVTPEENFHGYSHVALGDIDNDNLIEIVGITAGDPLADNPISQVVAYDHTGGAPKWSVPRPSTLGVRVTPALYDLDGDGEIEILMSKHVFKPNGEIKWIGEGNSVGRLPMCQCDHTSGIHGPDSDFSAFAMDFTEDYPGQEVIVGNQVYSANGNLLMTFDGPDGTFDGPSAIADLDMDGDPEFVLMDTARSRVRVIDHTGQEVWSDFYAGGTYAGHPTLSDINGDGYLEIAFATERDYFVYTQDGTQGTVLWSADIDDGSSGITGSTVFDFEGDGFPDVVYFDENFLRVYNADGTAKFSIQNNSGTWVEYPTIVDVDNDGHADILIPSSHTPEMLDQGLENPTAGVRAFQDRNNTWPATRTIWNQHSYHIDNVNEDGTIPQIPKVSYLTHNTFRLSSYPDRGGQEKSDLTLANLQLNTSDNVKILQVDLVNRSGLGINEPVEVVFYSGAPDLGGDEIGRSGVQSLLPLETKSVEIEVVSTAGWQDHIFAVIRYAMSVPECLEENNQLGAVYMKATVQNESNQFDVQEFLVTVKQFNESPQIASNPTGEVVVGELYEHQVELHENDLGDSYRFEVIGGPEGMFIHATKGVMQWWPTNAAAGVNNAVLRVTDSLGNFTELPFSVTVHFNESENRAPVITNVRTLVGKLSNATVGYTLEYHDPDGDTVTFEEVDGAPAEAKVNESYNPARLIWSLYKEQQELEPGLYQVPIKIIDEYGAFTVHVFPVWLTDKHVTNAMLDSGEVVPPQIVDQDDTLVFQIGTETTYALPMPDTDHGYNYFLVDGPDGLEVVNNTIVWSPAEVGDHEVKVQLANEYLSYSYSFIASARSQDNRQPVLIFDGFPEEAYLNQKIDYQFSWSDPDGDQVYMSVLELPDGAIMSEAGRLRWTPSEQNLSESRIRIRLSNKVNDGVTTNYRDYELIVPVYTHENTTPYFTQYQVPNYAAIGTSYGYQFLVTDEDGEPLSLSLSANPRLPSGMVVDNTGYVSISSVAPGDAGTFDILLIAQDAAGASAEVRWPLTISFNNAPYFTTEPFSTAYVGKSYRYGPRAFDQEGHGYSFSLVQNEYTPEGVSLLGSELYWMPSEEQVGDNHIQLRVTDVLGESRIQNINIHVFAGKIMERNICPAPDYLQ